MVAIAINGVSHNVFNDMGGGWNGPAFSSILFTLNVHAKSMLNLHL